MEPQDEFDLDLRIESARRQYTVGDLTEEIGALLTDAYTNIWVDGEISGLKLAGSGHAYFTLKDDRASLRCACWKGVYRLLRFKPAEGAEVLARGRIEVYEPRGEYQLIVDAIEPVGAGALQLAFERLKKKLAAEGLFEASRKRPLPGFPRRIGIVTSPTGAVIRDILHVIERRFPGLHIRIHPALVQGAGSVEQVVAGLDYFSLNPWADVVILARGGGSIEDLWTFNEEQVARAIARCAVPVISAIGHETDFTIADFAADLRAPTPSAAAEIVTATRDALLEQIRNAETRLGQSLRLQLARAARRLSELSTLRAEALVERRLMRAAQRLDYADAALARGASNQIRAAQNKLRLLTVDLSRFDARLRAKDMRARFERTRQRLQSAGLKILDLPASRYTLGRAKLLQLSPLNVLQRGYAVVTLPSGNIMRAPSEAQSGETLRLRLAGGETTATKD
jgi:exodeoxyribonuclease VII large subunit